MKKEAVWERHLIFHLFEYMLCGYKCATVPYFKEVLQCVTVKDVFIEQSIYCNYDLEQASGAYIRHVQAKYMVKRTRDRFKTLNQRTVTEIGLILTAIHLYRYISHTHTHTLFKKTTNKSLTRAWASFWKACAVKAGRAGSHAHPDLLHPNPL